MMRISENGLALIKHFEGFSAKPYRCPAGYLTIGYGHVLVAEDVKAVDMAAAEKLLRGDVRLAEKAVTRLVTRALAPGQFDALVSFTFNLGAGALQRSALRRAVNRGDDSTAVAQFPRWVFARGHTLAGLQARRLAEAAIYQGKPWFMGQP